jgi:arylsulfatase A-like enzyme
MFETSYVGSMPCMPARREIHTGRYNFLHNAWGPLEPFDDSMPEILDAAGIYTHLTSDHYHYWEDGGATYHNKYSSWSAHRGQEGDRWKFDLTPRVQLPDMVRFRPERKHLADFRNRATMTEEDHWPQARTFAEGLEFIGTNAEVDNWFLHVETFDPHEPYFVPPKYLEMYPHDYNGPHLDWPPYEPVTEDPATVEHLRCLNAALISFCDAQLGRILDAMDTHDLWDDTMLIVNTDHGFLLGEHDWWAKCIMPFYDEIARTPLFVWDPRVGQAGQKRQSLVQTIDLAPTLLDFFGQEIPKDMQGRPLRGVITDDTPIRQAGLFGIHGGHVNVTDGRYVYMRGPAREDNAPLNRYTVMPCHMTHTLSPKQLRYATLAEPFEFTKNCPLLKIPTGAWREDLLTKFGTILFDTQADPQQRTPLDDEAAENEMLAHLVRLMHESQSPPEQFQRLGLSEQLA